MRSPKAFSAQAGRGFHRAGYLGLTAAVAIADRLPPDLRFGHLRTATRILLSSTTVRTVKAERRDAGSAAEPTAPGPVASPADTRCALVTGSLDVGGVEAVIGLLALELPGVGVACDVICRSGGRMADTLRSQGVTVLETGTEAAVADAIRSLGPDVVQVHNAPSGMIDRLLELGVPAVPVVHNIELYRTPAAWEVHSRLSDVAPLTIAVSDAVRRHHLENTTLHSGAVVQVIPNGAPPTLTEGAPERDSARSSVAAVLGERLANDFLVVCLARYSAQKNLTGLVDGFLKAAERRPELQLIVAGDPEDWLEYRRADELRRSHRAADRVHLIGNSDAQTLLAAADAFILDSFFEGWPVSATEAVAMGIPLIMSDVGGARELIGADGARGTLVASPCGPSVTLRSVAAARRSLHQANRAEVAEAIVTTAQRSGERSGTDPHLFSHRDMVAAHAQALRHAARSHRPARTTSTGATADRA